VHACVCMPVCACLPVSTWSSTLREKHRLRVLENKVLRKIFGPKRDEVIGDWRGLYKEELCDLYSPNITRVIKPKVRW